MFHNKLSAALLCWWLLIGMKIALPLVGQLFFLMDA
jgi:hypothetical protein